MLEDQRIEPRFGKYDRASEWRRRVDGMDGWPDQLSTRCCVSCLVMVSLEHQPTTEEEKNYVNIKLHHTTKTKQAS